MKKYILVLFALFVFALPALGENPVWVVLDGKVQPAIPMQVAKGLTAFILPEGRTIWKLPSFTQAPDPSGWESAGFYNLSTKRLAVGAMHPITVFRDFLFKGLTVNLNGFAGLETGGQTPVLAAAFMVPFKVSGDGKFTAQLGAGISGSTGNKIFFGPAASVSIRF